MCLNNWMKYDPMCMLWHWITRNSFCVALNSFWSSFLKKHVPLFLMCTLRFSNPRHESVCLELCANGFVDASHIAKLFKISFATNMCRVYLCPRIMFFANPKKIFSPCSISKGKRNLRCNNLLVIQRIKNWWLFIQ